MRVIAGTARRLQLKTLPGDDTRPTIDQIKETLFNMINFDIPGSHFLDLYAGSGGIAIEALSRGAAHAVLVDNNPKAVAVIKDNLVHTHLDDMADCYTADAITALRKLESRETFDIVFLDPPYDAKLEISALTYLKKSKLITDDSIIILEARKEYDINALTDLGFDIDKVKEYKSNKHIFFKRSTR